MSEDHQLVGAAYSVTQHPKLITLLEMMFDASCCKAYNAGPDDVRVTAPKL